MPRSKHNQTIIDRNAPHVTKRLPFDFLAHRKLLHACCFVLLLSPISQVQAIQGRVQNPEGKSITNVLAEGKLYPVNELQVRNTTTKQLMVSELIPSGTSVDPGDQLIRFDSTEIEEQIGSARIELAAMEAETLAAKLKISSTEAESAATRITIESQLELLNLKSEHLFSNTGQFSFEVAEMERIRSLQQKRLNLLKKKLEFVRKHEEKESLAILELEFELQEAENLIASATQNMNRIKEHEIPFRKKELEAAVTELKSQLASTQSSFLSELETQKAALQVSKLALQQKQSSLEKLVDELKHCVIKAEKEGVVSYSSSLLKPGMNVRPNQELLSIYDPEELHVRVLVFGGGHEKIEQGQTASVQVFPNGDGRKAFVLQGKVSDIATQPTNFRERSRGAGYEVTIKLDENPDRSLVFSPVKVELKIE